MSSNLKEEALEKLQAGDVYSVVEFLDGQEDAVAALKTYNQLQRQLYWEEKNLGLSLALGRAGLQQGLQMGRRLASTDANLSKQLVGQAKALSYNLGSFAWPGWGDEGPPVSESDAVMGLDAAKVNFRLGTELERGDEPMGNAHWLLGAHYLAAGKLGLGTNPFRGIPGTIQESGHRVGAASGRGLPVGCRSCSKTRG